MSSSSSPLAGATGDPNKRPVNGGAQSDSSGRRPRGNKNNTATLPVDFAGEEDLLNDLKAFAQVMKLDLNKYVVEAVTAKFRADRERVRKEFNTKK